MKTLNYLMKIDFWQLSRLQTANFVHSLHDRLELLDQRIHGVLFVVHLLRQGENGLRLCLRDDSNAITVGHNDVARDSRALRYK